ncbi:MAG: hypothetical protein ABSA74_00325 [Candidatus Staskawiczbacteria bacterium]|jgi:hypothetical protein
MDQKIKYILLGILIVIIGFPTVVLGGTFAVSLIQGKTVEQAIQILAEQMDSLIGRVGVLEQQQCDESYKEVPSDCNYRPNIVEAYTLTKFIIENKLYSIPANLGYLQKCVDEAEPLYKAFIKRCPNYPVNKMSTTAQWCMSREALIKCSNSLPSDRQLVLPKYTEFNCDQLLKEEAPNRAPYECS